MTEENPRAISIHNFETPKMAFDHNLRCLIELDENRNREINKLSEQIADENKLIEELTKNRDEINCLIHAQQLDIQVETAQREQCIDLYNNVMKKCEKLRRHLKTDRLVLDQCEEWRVRYYKLRGPFDAQIIEHDKTKALAEAILQQYAVTQEKAERQVSLYREVQNKKLQESIEKSEVTRVRGDELLRNLINSPIMAAADEKLLSSFGQSQSMCDLNEQLRSAISFVTQQNSEYLKMKADAESHLMNNAAEFEKITTERAEIVRKTQKIQSELQVALQKEDDLESQFVHADAKFDALCQEIQNEFSEHSEVSLSELELIKLNQETVNSGLAKDLALLEELWQQESKQLQDQLKELEASKESLDQINNNLGIEIANLDQVGCEVTRLKNSLQILKEQKELNKVFIKMKEDLEDVQQKIAAIELMNTKSKIEKSSGELEKFLQDNVSKDERLQNMEKELNELKEREKRMKTMRGWELFGYQRFIRYREMMEEHELLREQRILESVENDKKIKELDATQANLIQEAEKKVNSRQETRHLRQCHIRARQNENEELMEELDVLDRESDKLKEDASALRVELAKEINYKAELDAKARAQEELKNLRREEAERKAERQKKHAESTRPKTYSTNSAFRLKQMKTEVDLDSQVSTIVMNDEEMTHYVELMSNLHGEADNTDEAVENSTPAQSSMVMNSKQTKKQNESYLPTTLVYGQPTRSTTSLERNKTSKRAQRKLFSNHDFDHSEQNEKEQLSQSESPSGVTAKNINSRIPAKNKGAPTQRKIFNSAATMEENENARWEAFVNEKPPQIAQRTSSPNKTSLSAEKKQGIMENYNKWRQAFMNEKKPEKAPRATAPGATSPVKNRVAPANCEIADNYNFEREKEVDKMISSDCGQSMSSEDVLNENSSEENNIILPPNEKVAPQSKQRDVISAENVVCATSLERDNISGPSESNEIEAVNRKVLQNLDSHHEKQRKNEKRVSFAQEPATEIALREPSLERDIVSVPSKSNANFIAPPAVQQKFSNSHDEQNKDNREQTSSNTTRRESSIERDTTCIAAKKNTLFAVPTSAQKKIFVDQITDVHGQPKPSDTVSRATRNVDDLNVPTKSNESPAGPSTQRKIFKNRECPPNTKRQAVSSLFFSQTLPGKTPRRPRKPKQTSKPDASKRSTVYDFM